LRTKPTSQKLTVTNTRIYTQTEYALQTGLKTTGSTRISRPLYNWL